MPMLSRESFLCFLHHKYPHILQSVTHLFPIPLPIFSAIKSSSSQDLRRANDPTSGVPLPPTQRTTSSESMVSSIPNAGLPSLSYLRSTSKSGKGSNHGRVLGHNEIGTELNYIQRDKTPVAPIRVRGHYVPLAEAVADDSQPDFDPYTTGGDGTPDPVVNGKGYDPRKLSPSVHRDGYGYSYNSYTPTSRTPSTGTETNFLKTPSPSLFPNGLPKPRKQHPFSRHYEVPQWKLLAVHVLLCLLAYPFLLLFVIIGRDRTLFWTRLTVGAGCGVMGFLLGLSLIGLARRHLEATAWATVIHQSRYHDHPGMRLKDIAPHAEDPVSAWNGFSLLWSRQTYPGTARNSRSHYDARPWSMHIIFFLALFGISRLLSFAFGRIVFIETQVKNQRENYYETAIKGDIATADIARAQNLATPFNDSRITWTLAPHSSHGSLPPAVDLQWINPLNTSQVDTMYFSETTNSQLQPNGSGFGTFETSSLTPSLDTLDSEAPVNVLQAGVSPGNIVRQPRWGIRIRCVNLPDAGNNILPISKNLSKTYVFIPKDTIGTLLDYYQKPFLDDIPPAALVSGDQGWPSNVDQNKTLYAASFDNNGVNHSYWSRPFYNMGADDTGFVSLEVVLIRLNSTYAAQGPGSFPVRGDSIPDINGTTTFIGYDAAVCIEVFEPWIVEVYNSTVGTPTTLRIVEKGNAVGDFKAGGVKEKRMGNQLITNDNGTDVDGVRKTLLSKRIQEVYVAAHQNSVNQIIKDNGRDSFYVPSTIAISYTTGQGPYGYTSLSASLFEQARGLADANNMLPYFAGSGSILARTYPDRLLASAYIVREQMIIALAVIFVLGLMAAFSVPRLPLDVPRRGFGLYSWVAAFYADELVGVGKGVPGAAGGTGKADHQSGGAGLEGGPGPIGLPIGRRMEIEEIEQRVGDVRFRYVP
ncbi:hypothetical protein P691DRAFT_775370 [Macrolepiota fuliginosa MF-IS2]|uniref:Uncharacterized protein n=1 Tax=Macrolepiota fuliginosa MF-IS2 TaxID=1400762 RepID=A0A9P5XD29_9AGAR|nr:hypothetical protein P691DRAFT_775370 [Macrolepiota fuliginosa MF-IS2]